MDLQELFNIISDSFRESRSQYHLTLGDLIDRLQDADRDAVVSFDIGGHPGKEYSYRGYYSDLSFDANGDKITAGSLLKRCTKMVGKSYDGYKGGDFTMSLKTPLWTAPYGCCGMAIVGLTERDDGAIILVTKA